MIRVNGEPLDFVVESVEELLSRLGVETRGVAVALDGDVIRKSDWAITRIVDGSAIEIVTAVAGG